MKFKESFLKHCESELFEINQNQLDIIEYLNTFHKENFRQSTFKKLFRDVYKALSKFENSLLVTDYTKGRPDPFPEI